MAVKVLKRGNTIFPMQITCPACHSLLEIGDAQDLRIFTTQELSRISYVDCPECKNHVTLDKAETVKALAERDRQGEWRGK